MRSTRPQSADAVFRAGRNPLNSVWGPGDLATSLNERCAGRHLQPVNFNTEIFLEINLGPTYLAEKLVTEVYNLRTKEYLYKENIDGVARYATRVADEKYGSALKTFRKEQDSKSRFPASFWK